MFLLEPKHWLGNPEQYLFVFSKMVFTGSNNSKNIIFKFEDVNTRDVVVLQQQGICNAAFGSVFVLSATTQ